METLDQFALNELLIKRVEEEDCDGVRRILQQGGEALHRRSYAIRVAARRNLLEIVQLLLPVSDLQWKGDVLYQAVSGGAHSCVNLVIDHTPVYEFPRSMCAAVGNGAWDLFLQLNERIDQKLREEFVQNYLWNSLDRALLYKNESLIAQTLQWGVNNGLGPHMQQALDEHTEEVFGAQRDRLEFMIEALHLAQREQLMETVCNVDPQRQRTAKI